MRCELLPGKPAGRDSSLPGLPGGRTRKPLAERLGDDLPLTAHKAVQRRLGIMRERRARQAPAQALRLRQLL